MNRVSVHEKRRGQAQALEMPSNGRVVVLALRSEHIGSRQLTIETQPGARAAPVIGWVPIVRIENALPFVMFDIRPIEPRLTETRSITQHCGGLLLGTVCRGE